MPKSEFGREGGRRMKHMVQYSISREGWAFFVRSRNPAESIEWKLVDGGTPMSKSDAVEFVCKKIHESRSSGTWSEGLWNGRSPLFMGEPQTGRWHEDERVWLLSR